MKALGMTGIGRLWLSGGGIVACDWTIALTKTVHTVHCGSSFPEGHAV